MERSTESPRDKPCMQVVVFDNQTRNPVLLAVGGVEGRDRCIYGENKFEVKILEGNKIRLPLRFNMNSNSRQIVSDKESDCRNSSWLRKGLIVEVKGNCRRQVLCASCIDFYFYR